MTKLHAVAYTSRATRQLTPPDLDRLLLAAQSFNEARGVTGVLLYHEGLFFQFVEGPASEVATVYARIRKATIHGGILELLNAPVSHRQFSSWHMGFCEPAESELQALQTASWEEAIPMTREIYERSPGLALLLYYWSKWKAEPFSGGQTKLERVIDTV